MAYPERSGTAHDVRYIVDEFGPGRVIFGSGWPMAAPAGAYADTIETTLALLSWLDEDEQDRVMRGNAMRLYGFEHAHEPHPIGRTA